MIKLKENIFQGKETDNDDSMAEELNISLQDRLKDIGINEILIDELVSAAVRVNYGQVMIKSYGLSTLFKILQDLYYGKEKH